MKISGENLVNDWLEDTGRFKNDSRFQTPVVPWRLMVPLTKRKSLFSMEKNKTKEVTSHITLV